MSALLRRLHSRLLRDYIGLSIPLLVWVVFFAPILSGQSVYFLDDLKIIYYPLEVAYAEYQSNFDLPLWENNFGFGQPLLGWAQLGFFTPLHVLLRFAHVPPLVLLQVSVASYFLLGLLGFYVFLRRQQLLPLACGLGAALYCFSGFSIGHLNHVNFYVGTMVLPWLLVAIHYFLKHPSLIRSLGMAAATAIIIVSAQPQVALYSIIVATLYGVMASIRRRPAVIYYVRLVTLTLLAAALALAVGSLTVLPLLEFLPLTERAQDLPITQLLDFSYAPSHAITLLLPYFFGDHDSYWGAKGFQELAAFTGLIPLTLAGLALTGKNRRTALTWWAIALVAGSIVLALGQYSPVYSALVANYIITSLTIPGRFVMFFNIGIAVLAAIGLQLIIERKISLRQSIGALVPLLFFIPFGIRFLSDARVQDRLEELVTSGDSMILVVGISAVAMVGLFFQRLRHHPRYPLTLAFIAAATVLTYSWNYNPRSTYATTQLPFAETLAETSTPHTRLYSRADLLSSKTRQEQRASSSFGPDYSLWQPIPAEFASPCLVVPLFSADEAQGAITISLHDDLSSSPLEQHQIVATDIVRQPEQVVCFTARNPAGALLSLQASERTSINGYLAPTSVPSAHVVRVANPTLEQINASQKMLRVVFTPEPTIEHDPEAILLARHLNLVAHTSSARWIGALSIQPYREFIEFYFANDRDDVIDGDGRHFLQTGRRFFNAAGVTHFAQALAPDVEDTMAAADFTTVAEWEDAGTRYRLYENPAAFSKAYTVRSAEFIPAADEARARMLDPTFNFSDSVVISGPVPPTPDMLESEEGLATLSQRTYSDTTVVYDIEVDEPVWLIVTDATTPQWHTYIDGEIAPHYTANTMFKAAYVPAGQHTVQFRYESEAATKASRYALLGSGAWILLLVYSLLRSRLASQESSPPHTS